MIDDDLIDDYDDEEDINDILPFGLRNQNIF